MSHSKMQPMEFFDWTLNVDRHATRDATASWESPDPGCCNACATFVAVVKRHLLPPPIELFLRSVGLDVRVPQEVWGTPDTGFLGAWWVFVGTLDSGAPGALGGGHVEPMPGFRCWLTNDISMDALR